MRDTLYICFNSILLCSIWRCVLGINKVFYETIKVFFDINRILVLICFMRRIIYDNLHNFYLIKNVLYYYFLVNISFLSFCMFPGLSSLFCVFVKIFFAYIYIFSPFSTNIHLSFILYQFTILSITRLQILLDQFAGL